MGTRVTNTLNDDPYYWMLYIERDDAGQARLSRVIDATSQEEAGRELLGGSV